MPEGAKDYSLLFSEYQGSFPGVNVERAPPSSTEDENELTRTSLPTACL
jgi:hypothetical protein